MHVNNKNFWSRNKSVPTVDNNDEIYVYENGWLNKYKFDYTCPTLWLAIARLRFVGRVLRGPDNLLALLQSATGLSWVVRTMRDLADLQAAMTPRLPPRNQPDRRDI